MSTVESRCGCQSPTELEAKEAIGTSVVLSWYTAEPASGFAVEVALSGRDTEKDAVRYSSESNRLVINSLQPSTAYRFRVSSQCHEAPGGVSAWKEFNSGRPVPAQAVSGMAISAANTNLHN